MIAIPHLAAKPARTRFGATISVDKSAQNPEVLAAVHRHLTTIGQLPSHLRLEYSLRTNAKKRVVHHVDVYDVGHPPSSRKSAPEPHLLRNFVEHHDDPKAFLQSITTTLNQSEQTHH